MSDGNQTQKLEAGSPTDVGMEKFASYIMMFVACGGVAGLGLYLLSGNGPASYLLGAVAGFVVMLLVRISDVLVMLHGAIHGKQ